jgi:hypothetical protein
MLKALRNTPFLVMGLFALTLALSSCKKEEGCTDPNSLNYNPDAEVDDGTCEYPVTEGTAKVTFDYVWGMNQEPWTVGNTYVHPKTGDTLTFTTLKFYVSNIRLKNMDGTWWSEPESYHLVCASCPDASSITLTDVPVGHYTEMEYTLGVDSARNVSGAQTGALSPTMGMFWSWNTGYIMLKVEGHSPNSPDGSFAFHLGGFTSDVNVVTPKSVDFGTTHLMVEGGMEPEIRMTANPARLWHTADGLSQTNLIHMPGPTAQTMAVDFFSNVSFTAIN